jgi:hypothetical protein
MRSWRNRTAGCAPGSSTRRPTPRAGARIRSTTCAGSPMAACNRRSSARPHRHAIVSTVARPPRHGPRPAPPTARPRQIDPDARVRPPRPTAAGRRRRPSERRSGGASSTSIVSCGSPEAGGRSTSTSPAAAPFTCSMSATMATEPNSGRFSNRRCRTPAWSRRGLRWRRAPGLHGDGLPERAKRGLQVFAEGGRAAVHDMTIWQMQSIWFPDGSDGP